MLRLLATVACTLSIASAHAATVTVLAGTGSPTHPRDREAATDAAVKDPFGVQLGPDGALYVTEVGRHRIRRVDLKTNRISTVAGSGIQGYAGDGGPATQAKLNEPYEVRFDKLGNMYFVEMQNHIVRRVDAKTKLISTIAGSGDAGFHGDGGPATKAAFRRPHSIALDGHGQLFVADIGNHRIRRIHLASGIVDTIAGTGEKKLPVDGQLAKGASLFGPRALYVAADTMWIALRKGNSVWSLDLRSGRLAHVAGTGAQGHRDGGPSEAAFNGPKGVAVDRHHNVFVVDTENHSIRRIDGATRNVTTVAGDGHSGAQIGDAGQAVMNRPHGICLGRAESLFVGDTLNHRVIHIE